MPWPDTSPAARERTKRNCAPWRFKPGGLDGDDPRRCRAVAASTGERCKRVAVRGRAKCFIHRGGASCHPVRQRIRDKARRERGWTKEHGQQNRRMRYFMLTTPVPIELARQEVWRKVNRLDTPARYWLLSGWLACDQDGGQAWRGAVRRVQARRGYGRGPGA